MAEKINSVESSFELLLESISSVNKGIMGLSSEAFTKGDLEKAQEYNDKSSSLLRFTKNLFDLKNNWDSQFSESVKTNKSAVVPTDIPSVLPIPPVEVSPMEVPSVRKVGYICNGEYITMEFKSSGGRGYSIKISKVVFAKVATYIVDYLKVNEYIQSKDILSALGEYLSTNTNYKEKTLSSITSKTLRFLKERELLAFRNGMTGYYKLAGTAKDIFDFLDTFDKRD